MNHIFRVIFNHSLQCWQAVAEIGRRQHKTRSEKSATTTLSTPRLFKLLPLSALVALSLQNAFAAPQGGQVSAGQATITQQGKVTDIHQSSQNAAINWQKFDVAPKETVNFHQPNKDAITLNRVTGKEESVIQGAINAKGNVFISNPNGVLIGNNAQINVGSLVATTQAIKDEDLMHGKLKFDGQAGGKVENNADIRVPKGGVIALIAPIVKNNGKLTAFEGNVLLASAEKFSITLPKDNFSYTLDRGTLQGLVDNKGAILADGGRVVLTAKGINAVKKSVIKHSGVIEANTVRQQNGVIELLGDLDHSELQLSGTIKAEGKGKAPGGKVETSAAKLKISDKAKVSTKSEKGKTGKWTIDPKDFVVAKEGGDITGKQVSQFLASNDMELKSRDGKIQEGKGDVIINDEIAWDKNTLTLNAENDIKINQPLNGLGEAKLALKYGQGSSDGGSADYYVNAQVNLPAGKNFSIQKGENGERKAFTVYHQMPEIVKNANGDWVSQFTEKYIAFGQDMDLSYTKNYLGFAGWELPNNSAIIDGLGHVLNKLTLSSISSNQNTALFINNSNGLISNIGVTDINVSSTGGHYYLASYTAGLVGEVKDIFNSYVTGNITTSGETAYAAGLAGLNKGSILNSYASIDITTLKEGASIGGLVSYNQGDIGNSYTIGNVTASGGIAHSGGLVGLNEGNITNSYSMVNVNTLGSNSHTGGLIGVNGDNGTINNGFSAGNVLAKGEYSRVGGLVGTNYGYIRNSYTIGNVTAFENRGDALVGFYKLSTIFNSYAVNKVNEKNKFNVFNTTGIKNNISTEERIEYIKEHWDMDNTWSFIDDYEHPILSNWNSDVWVKTKDNENLVLKAFHTKAIALPEQPAIEPEKPKEDNSQAEIEALFQKVETMTKNAENAHRSWVNGLTPNNTPHPNFVSNKNIIAMSNEALALAQDLPFGDRREELFIRLSEVGRFIQEVKPQEPEDPFYIADDDRVTVKKPETPATKPNKPEVKPEEQTIDPEQLRIAQEKTRFVKNAYDLGLKKLRGNEFTENQANEFIEQLYSQKQEALTLVNALPDGNDKSKLLAALSTVLVNKPEIKPVLVPNSENSQEKLERLDAEAQKAAKAATDYYYTARDRIADNLDVKDAERSNAELEKLKATAYEAVNKLQDGSNKTQYLSALAGIKTLTVDQQVLNARNQARNAIDYYRAAKKRVEQNPDLVNSENTEVEKRRKSAYELVNNLPSSHYKTQYLKDLREITTIVAPPRQKIKLIEEEKPVVKPEKEQEIVENLNLQENSVLLVNDCNYICERNKQPVEFINKLEELEKRLSEFDENSMFNNFYQWAKPTLDLINDMIKLDKTSHLLDYAPDKVVDKIGYRRNVHVLKYLSDDAIDSLNHFMDYLNKSKNQYFKRNLNHKIETLAKSTSNLSKIGKAAHAFDNFLLAISVIESSIDTYNYFSNSVKSLEDTTDYLVRNMSTGLLVSAGITHVTGEIVASQMAISTSGAISSSAVGVSVGSATAATTMVKAAAIIGAIQSGIALGEIIHGYSYKDYFKYTASHALSTVNDLVYEIETISTKLAQGTITINEAERLFLKSKTESIETLSRLNGHLNPYGDSSEVSKFEKYGIAVIAFASGDSKTLNNVISYIGDCMQKVGEIRFDSVIELMELKKIISGNIL